MASVRSRAVGACIAVAALLNSVGPSRAEPRCPPRPVDASAELEPPARETAVALEKAGERRRSMWLPRTLLFRPPIADFKEPRFYLGYQRMGLSGTREASSGREIMDAGLVAAGTTLGVWGHRDSEGEAGFQLDLTGGVFSQFNLGTPMRDLVNTDFLFGIVGSWRNGPWSARARVWHQSRHLGDDFLLHNGDVFRRQITYEVVDALLSLDIRRWRLYAGGGYVWHAIPAFDPWSVQAGGSWHGRCVRPHGQENVWFAPVVAFDANVVSARRWAPTLSAKAGIVMARNGVRLRLLATYLYGNMPFGQFFLDERVHSFGIELQLEP